MSKTEFSADFYTEAIANSIVNVSHSCATNATQTQVIDFTNEGGTIDLQNIDFDQEANINLSCLQNIKTDVTSQSKLVEDIATKISDKISGQTIGAQSNLSKTTMKSITKVVNNLNFDSITSCLGNATQEQAIKFTNKANGDVYINGVTFRQSLKLVQDCIQNEETTIANIAELQKVVKTELEKETVGFLNTMSITVIALIVFMILLIVILVVWMYKSIKSGEAVPGMSKSAGNSFVTLLDAGGNAVARAIVK